MESERFDRLVWTFSQAHSRRQALRGLAGAAVVAAVALGGRRASAAQCKAADVGCKNSHQCCSGLFCRRAAGAPKSASGICTAPQAELCDNGIDDNGDLRVDCSDPNCYGVGSCPTPQAELCSNGIDDDLDGSIDNADPDCHGV